MIKIAHPDQTPNAILTIIDEDNGTQSTRTCDNDFLRNIIQSQMTNVGDFFKDIGIQIPQMQQQQAPCKNSSSSTTASSKPASAEAAMIASVIGGNAEDFEKIVEQCKGMELDEMIECAMAYKDLMKKCGTPTVPWWEQNGTPEPEPSTVFKLDEKNHVERGRKMEKVQEEKKSVEIPAPK